MRSHALRVLGVLLLVSLGLARAGTDPSPAPGPPGANEPFRVSIDNFTFKPATLSVPVGGTVEWTNRDDMPHTIVADDKSFRSDAIDTDGTFSRRFTVPGTYRYFCSIHPKMTGEVVVRAK